MKLKVYHRKLNPFAPANPFPTVGDVAKALRDGDFDHVADVDVTGLVDLDAARNKAFRLTNHVEEDWTKGDEVTVHGDDRKRSTSVGDVFSMGDHYWMVAPTGFKHFMLDDKDLLTTEDLNEELRSESDLTVSLMRHALNRFNFKRHELWAVYEDVIFFTGNHPADAGFGSSDTSAVMASVEKTLKRKAA